MLSEQVQESDVVLLDPSDKNCTGVVYCPNQKTPVQYIVEKLESGWVWYEQGLANKSKNVAVKTTANKLKALLEIQKHVELFGGYIKIEEDFEIFSAHQVGYSDKRTFIRALTDQNTGLNVHVVQVSLCSVLVRYIVNKTPGFTVENFLTSLSSRINEMLSERQDLRITFTKDVFQDISHALDTEWDRLCAKVLYAGNLTEKEMVSVGIDPDTVRNGTERIKYVSDEVKNAFLAANDIFDLKIRSKLNKIKENNEQVLLKLERSKEHLSEKRKLELEISSRVNEERIADLEMLLISNDGASTRRKQKAV